MQKAAEDMYGHELDFATAKKYQSPMRKPIAENEQRFNFMQDLQGDMWGVEVSDKFILQISGDGSYEIIWTTGDGADEEVEVHVKEKGQLKALN